MRLAEFLCELRDSRGLATSTIEGYRTAVASTLLGCTGVDLGKDRDLSRLMANLARESPRNRPSAPNWDLSLVLLQLTRQPFEPLHEASLKLLTWKTVFLVALASGKRRGELHALTKTFQRGEGWEDITLFMDPAFIAKTELAARGSSGTPLTIPSLYGYLGPGMQEDRTLCPVRALRFYLDRTQELRADKAKLFVSYKTGFKGDIAKATISHWIKNTIVLAYELAGRTDADRGAVRAHDVRGMAASWARLANVALEDIMRACSWKSHNTFTSFYLKDLTRIQDQVLKLGPLVAAQHITSA